MASIAIPARNGKGKLTNASIEVGPIRDRIRQAREWRRGFEGSWQLELALAAGRHWQSYDKMTRTLRSLADTDPRYKDRELYSADMVTEYRTTMLGELGSDNDRPQLLLQKDDRASEAYESQANRALGFGWEHEWHGDNVLAQVDRLMLDLGTAAVRVRYDASVGPVVADNVPFRDGRPVLDTEEARGLLAGGPNRSVKMGQIRQGRIRWEPLSCFNLIVPPGVPHEDNFPWECVVMPTPLDSVKDEYGALAKELVEDTDIGSILGTDTQGSTLDPTAWGTGDGRKGRLRDHVWLFHFFEHPCPKYEKGRVLVFGGNDLVLLDTRNELPYRAPDGSYRSGLSYFHWWRVTGRFWSRSLVSAMLDGQRLLDKRRTQLNEIIDRSMPMVLVERGSKALDRTGVPGEFVEVDRSERQPLPIPGIQPGGWMQGDVQAIREDIDHATGIKGPRLGENPQNITTYSQLALVQESEAVKREQIHRERKLAIGRLVEDSLYDIRTYWGPHKQIMLASDNDQVEAEVFNATRIPAFFIVTVATGAAKPRSQAAKLKMVEDIAAYSVQSRQPVPVSWLKQSLEAGEPLELPEPGVDAQTEKAQLENDAMLEGEPRPVAYYDLVDIHIPIHRVAQDQVMLTGEKQTFDLIEQHVQAHLAAAQQNASEVQQMLPPGQPGAEQPPAAAAAAGAPPELGSDEELEPPPGAPQEPGAAMMGPIGPLPPLSPAAPGALPV